MVTVRNPFKRQDSVDAVADPTFHQTVSNEVKTPSDEKDAYAADVQDTLPVDNPYGEVHNEKNLLANGKERPIEVSPAFPPLVARRSSHDPSSVEQH